MSIILHESGKLREKGTNEKPKTLLTTKWKKRKPCWITVETSSPITSPPILSQIVNICDNVCVGSLKRQVILLVLANAKVTLGWYWVGMSVGYGCSVGGGWPLVSVGSWRKCDKNTRHQANCYMRGHKHCGH